MKITFLLVCACVVLNAKSYEAAVKAPLDIISLEDLTPEERAALEFLDKQERPKRSGDLLATLKHSIGQGIKNKIGQIAKSSASASAHFSSSSSGGGGGGGGYHYHHHEAPPESYDHKSFDFWTLKKSILNTLLQAVKAIKGGVIAIKGQLIKGGGHLISAKGKLISAKGEAITSLGKHIASSAILSPFPGHSGPSAHSGPSGHEEHVEYGPPPSHYGPPSGPSDVYGAPSAPSQDYGHPSHDGPSNVYLPQKLHAFEDQIPHGAQAGILILKKIPKGRAITQTAEESNVPPFKPIKPEAHSKLAGFTDIVGKFMSASSSFSPDKPHIESHHESPPEHHYEHEEYNEYKHTEQPHESQKTHESKPTHEHVPPSTSYGTPFELEEPPKDYLDFYKTPHDQPPADFYKKPSDKPHNSEQSSANLIKEHKTNKDHHNPPKTYQNVESQNTKYILPTPLPTNYQTDAVPTSYSIGNNGYQLPTAPENLPNIESFPPYPGELPADFVAQYGLQNTNQYNLDSTYNFNTQQFKQPLLPQYQLQSNSNQNYYNYYNTDQFNGLKNGFDHNKNNVKLFSQMRNPQQTLPSGPINSYGAPVTYTQGPFETEIPSDTLTAPSIKQSHKYQQIKTPPRQKQPFDLVRSVSYKLGPNGPIKL